MHRLLGSRHKLKLFWSDFKNFWHMYHLGEDLGWDRISVSYLIKYVLNGWTCDSAWMINTNFSLDFKTFWYIYIYVKTWVKMSSVVGGLKWWLSRGGGGGGVNGPSTGRLSFGWSSIWHSSNTGSPSQQSEQTSILLGSGHFVWPSFLFWIYT